MAIEVLKILRNNSGSELIVLNKILANGESYDVPQQYWSDLKYDTELVTLINSGDIIVNDGINDLSISDALVWIERWQLDEAEDIIFNNSGNNFDSTDVQSAIKEAKFEGKNFNIVDAGIFRTSRQFGAYNSANLQNITTSVSTIQINTQFDASDGGSYLLSSGEIEFLDEHGDYKITYSVTFDNTNSTRTNTQSFLEKFNGSTWNKIIGSDVYTYERTSNADRQTGSTTILATFNKLEKIRVRSQIIEGSNNTNVAQGCVITIEPAQKETGVLKNLGLDCKTVVEKDDILSIWNCGEL